MGLPPSDGNTTILTVVTRFSKSFHFIPLPNLPSAKETTNLMLMLHGLPVEVVSDRDHNSRPVSERPFVSCLLVPLSVYPLVFISRVTARPRERISNWRRCCTAWLPRTLPSGANSCLGQSMPSTLIFRPPLVELPSSAPWVTSLYFSQTRRGEWVYHLLNRSSAVAFGRGDAYAQPFFAPQPG